MNVPLRTSLYFQIKTPPADKPGAWELGSLDVRLQPGHGPALELLAPDAHFVPPAAGWTRPSSESICVYVEPGRPLSPLTRYTVRLSVKTARTNARIEAGAWSFTTEATPSVRSLNYRVDLRAPSVRWHGRFFDGVCNVIFCSRAADYGPTYDLMREAHREHPRAWRLKRDFWLTGTDYQHPPQGFFPSNLPNIVRERETRRITAVRLVAGRVVLHLEDFFGHEQYGIPASRPLSRDYHPGDEVLVADGDHHGLAQVLAADNAAGTVTLRSLTPPPGGWKIAYGGPLPRREVPNAPGLFPPGGCYLRKYNPPGTPCYYWGRLDKEWDLARRNGWRLVPNFADAPADLSLDGQSWTTVKDYAEWHQVVRKITGHIVDRYGKAALGFTWSIFNEPDLRGVFWRSNRQELQKYYDYTSDAILRAFEDRGYDSQKVFIGGFELATIFGTNFPPSLRLLLAHCSPRAKTTGALPVNAAFADPRLDGRRSHRVEALCRSHGGKGSPCDFISIHSYNRSSIMAAKLIQAKATALALDPGYYRNLWVDSHESCPDWAPPPDEAAGDVYRGDGYFSSWCADVVHRQLLQAALDLRFAYGETILTVWPPPPNFTGANAMTRVIHYRDKQGRKQTATVPWPIFHFLGLLSDLGDQYWVLPEWSTGGRVVGGFGSRDPHGIVRFLLYTHDAQDTQSRSDESLKVTLELDGLGGTDSASVREYRLDRDHNSPFRLIQQLTNRNHKTIGMPPFALYSEAQLAQIRQACQCHSIRSAHLLDAPGRLRLTTDLEENGCSFLVIRPQSVVP